MDSKNRATAARQDPVESPSWLTLAKRSSGSVVPQDLRWLFADTRARAGITEYPMNVLRPYASYHLARFNDGAALALQVDHTSTSIIFEHHREVV